MPSFEDIEQFASALRILAKEEEELQKSGEPPPVIPRPVLDYDSMLKGGESTSSTSLEGSSAQATAQRFFEEPSETGEAASELVLGDEQLSDFEAIYAQSTPEEASPAQSTPEEPSPAQSSPEEPSPAQPSPEEPSPAQPSPEEPSLEELSLAQALEEISEVPPIPSESSADDSDVQELLQSDIRDAPTDEAQGTPSTDTSSQEDDILSELLRGGPQEDAQIETHDEDPTASAHEDLRQVQEDQADAEAIEKLHSTIEEIKLDTSDITRRNIPQQSSIRQEGEAPKEEEQGPEDFSEEEFQKIIASIDALPLELKKATVTYITDENQPEKDTRHLTSLLSASASPYTIARFINRRTGLHIEVPQGYVKETVQALEKRSQEGFEKFKHTYAPIIVTVAVWMFGILLSGYLALTFLYRPIAAGMQYRRAHAAIQNDEFSRGNERFIQAWGLWPSDSWLFRFSDTFVSKGEYGLAVEKYEQLVYGINPSLRTFLIQKTREGLLSDLFEIQEQVVRPIDLINPHKKGIFTHAELQTQIFGDYEKALDLISILLEIDKFDKDALLAQGDVFIRQGDREGAQYYQNAAASYQRALSEHSRDAAIMSRIGWQATRTNHHERVMEAVEYFNQDKTFDIVPEMHSDIVGYLIDSYTLETIPRLISQIHATDPYFPEMYYQLARYSRIVERPPEELAALQDAITLFHEEKDLRFQKLFMFVDSYIRLGEYFYERGRFLDAEQSFQSAVTHYEGGIDHRILDASAELGRVYEALGNIRYYQSNIPDEAFQYFERARRAGIDSEDLSYKIGYLLYYNKNYQDAALFFLDAETTVEENLEAQLAVGNTLYHMENYASSATFFQAALDTLQEARSLIPRIFLDDNDTHRELVETLIATHNNLGASLYRHWERSSEQKKYGEALYQFEQSIALSENARRDPNSKQRSEAKSLAYINLREALYPRANFSVQIYPSIPLDRQSLSFKLLEP